MLAIQLEQNRTAFSPGDPIDGTVQWELPDAPRSVELRLCWYTTGEGSEESELVQTQKFISPTPSERPAFHFVAPTEPYSYLGHLISLHWALELVVQPGNQFEREEIVIGPDAHAVELPANI
jgi:hypothetical protein